MEKILKAKDLLLEEIEELKDNKLTDELLDEFEIHFENLNFEVIDINLSNDNKKIVAFFYILGVFELFKKVKSYLI